MRPFCIILATAVLTSSAGIWISKTQKDSANKRLEAARTEWARERSELESALARARQTSPSVVMTAPQLPETVSYQGPTPEEIIEKLKAIRVGVGNSNKRANRLVIHYLETLVDMGPRAVEPIRAFLGRFEDIDYVIDNEERGDRGGEDGRPDRGMRDFMRNRGRAPRLTFDFPPSLRMGLAETLKQIGTPEAEGVLREMLETTARGIEVAYVTTLLQEMTPNKYKDVALASARDLLSNPPVIEKPNRYDQRATEYLYHVLTMYGDTSYATGAERTLVSANGTINREALNYLTATLKESSVPLLEAAYKDPRVTNMWDKAAVMSMALQYVGANQTANSMLNEVISNAEVPGPMKMMAVSGLTRGEQTPELAKARQPVVEALKGSTDDERMLRVLDATSKNLQNIVEGKPVEENLFRFRDNAGGGRRRGNEGPPGLPFE